MTLKEFKSQCGLEILTEGCDETEISEVYCCDLLSFAMSRNPAGSVWVTVMGNINTVAVAVLTEGGCVIVAEGAEVDDNAVKKATEQNVCIMKTDMPVFETALKMHKIITG